MVRTSLPEKSKRRSTSSTASRRQPCSASGWIEAVVAVIVPKPGATLSTEDVYAHVRAALAGHKRPKYVVFTDARPKNPSGKILKKELRVQYPGLADSDM
ncbi:MAG TPA: hypothetical protein VGD71_39735 [Kribbella sp.]